MKEMFCERCGTLITEKENCCSFCKRQVDWSTGRQYDIDTPETKIPSYQGNFPQRLFQQPQQKQTPSRPMPNRPDFRPMHTTAIDTTGKSDFLKPLGMGEMILLVLCWCIPVLGTVLLALASFVDSAEYRNRKTAARALLIVQLVMMVVTIIIIVAIVSVVLRMSYSATPNMPIW